MWQRRQRRWQRRQPRRLPRRLLTRRRPRQPRQRLWRRRRPRPQRRRQLPERRRRLLQLARRPKQLRLRRRCKMCSKIRILEPRFPHSTGRRDRTCRGRSSHGIWATIPLHRQPPPPPWPPQRPQLTSWQWKSRCQCPQRQWPRRAAERKLCPGRRTLSRRTALCLAPRLGRSAKSRNSQPRGWKARWEGWRRLLKRTPMRRPPSHGAWRRRL